MLKKSTMKTIPLAIAMTAALLFGAGAQAQTPSTATGGAANPPASANTTPKTMEQRDTAKPMAQSGTNAGVSGTGGKANPPAGSNAAPKTKEQHDKSKPMSKSGMNSDGSAKAPARLDKLPQDTPRTTSR